MRNAGRPWHFPFRWYLRHTNAHMHSRRKRFSFSFSHLQRRGGCCWALLSFCTPSPARRLARPWILRGPPPGRAWPGECSTRPCSPTGQEAPGRSGRKRGPRMHRDLGDTWWRHDIVAPVGKKKAQQIDQNVSATVILRIRLHGDSVWEDSSLFVSISWFKRCFKYYSGSTQ